MGSESGATGINVGEGVVTVQEFTKKRVSTASGTTKDISGHRCILRGVIVNTAPVNAVTINDAATPFFVIPAATPIGSWLPFGDVGMSNINLTHTASAGDLTFIFKSF